jgi:hypothetical protein
MGLAKQTEQQLTLQGVNSPDLQCMIVYIRQIFHAPLVPLEAAPQILERALAAASSNHWQVRMAAIIALQPFWHR